MRPFFSMMLCFAFAPKIFCQTVVIDWVGKSLQSSPLKINQRTKGTIQVLHVNDVLYQYSIQLSATPRVNDDFKFLQDAFLKRAGEAASDKDCTALLETALTATKALQSALTSFYKLPETPSLKKKSCSALSPCTYDMTETRGAWKGVAEKIKPADEAVSAIFTEQYCANNYGKDATDFKSVIDAVNAQSVYIDAGEHTITAERTLDPDVDYTVDVKELYVSQDSKISKPTDADTLSVKFSPANDRLTLSAGVLISTVQNRSYTSQAEPNSSNTGTQNVLVVSGQSAFTPQAVALLNYELPSIGKAKFSNDNFGIALSTGPTLRFGSKSDTSSFGYFFGMGLHLYHRFYLSPGLHIGEFADYPPGFSQPAQVIPSGLGTPMPVKRYTLRFAFGITYKAKDFSGLGLKASVTPKAADTALQSAPSSNP